MKYPTRTEIDPRYQRQQEAMLKIARNLGVVMFKPNYHGEDRECHTVLFYTKEDHEYNLKVECEYGNWARNDQFRRQFFSFENTDCNGRRDLDFGNRGKIDLRGLGYAMTLEGHIRYAYAKHREKQHIVSAGGVLGLPEADDEMNDLQREIIEAVRLKSGGVAILGKIYGKPGEAIYTEYHGGKVYNSEYDFVVPQMDEELEAAAASIVGDTPCSVPDKFNKLYDLVEKKGGDWLTWK